MTEELLKISSDMTGLILPTEYSSRFKAMATEAKETIDEELGAFNDYSFGLAQARNSGEGSYFGGPSYVAVEEAANLVEAAYRAIKRRTAKPPRASAFSDAPYVSVT